MKIRLYHGYLVSDLIIIIIKGKNNTLSKGDGNSRFLDWKIYLMHESKLMTMRSLDHWISSA